MFWVINIKPVIAVRDRDRNHVTRVVKKMTLRAFDNHALPWSRSHPNRTTGAPGRAFENLSQIMKNFAIFFSLWFRSRQLYLLKMSLKSLIFFQAASFCCRSMLWSIKYFRRSPRDGSLFWLRSNRRGAIPRKFSVLSKSIWNNEWCNLVNV